MENCALQHDRHRGARDMTGLLLRTSASRVEAVALGGLDDRTAWTTVRGGRR